MRRRVAVVLAATAVLVGAVWAATAVGSATDGRGTFTDDDGSVHEADINGLAASEITKGCNPPANTLFCPVRPVTRAEMASFLVRALDLPGGSPGEFTDTAGSVHAADIDALAAADITRGCNPPDNTNYCPSQPVTREQMASFLVRALALPSTDSSTFADTSGSVHRADIDALAAAGITKGCNPPANTNYCPQAPVTRQQMASFLVRALDDVEPILNRLSMRSGLSCSKDGLSCTGRVTLATGTRLELREGWYQVLPYRSGEEAAFKAAGTAVVFTWDGAAIDRSFLGLRESTSPATRTWQAQPPPLTPGAHTLRAVWNWNGAVTQTVTWVITGS